jgi:hypothetical protein
MEALYRPLGFSHLPLHTLLSEDNTSLHLSERTHFYPTYFTQPTRS